jgi:hypothetical protein
MIVTVTHRRYVDFSHAHYEYRAINLPPSHQTHSTRLTTKGTL